MICNLTHFLVGVRPVRAEHPLKDLATPDQDQLVCIELLKAHLEHDVTQLHVVEEASHLGQGLPLVTIAIDPTWRHLIFLVVLIRGWLRW